MRSTAVFRVIDPARKEWHSFPSIPAKYTGMDGAPTQNLVAGSIGMEPQVIA
jgi:hypothetical protein